MKYWFFCILKKSIPKHRKILILINRRCSGNFGIRGITASQVTAEINTWDFRGPKSVGGCDADVALCLGVSRQLDDPGWRGLSVEKELIYIALPRAKRQLYVLMEDLRNEVALPPQANAIQEGRQIGVFTVAHPDAQLRQSTVNGQLCWSRAVYFVTQRDRWWRYTRDHDGEAASCTGYTTCLFNLFSEQRRAQVRPVAGFFVRQKLLRDATKASPLYKVFIPKKLGNLASVEARTARLNSWESNRGQQFAKVKRAKK